MNYKVVYDLTSGELYQLRNILKWKEISLKQLDIALKHTQYKVCIKNDSDIIACGRIVTDYSCKGVLSDILVNPKYQKQGFGRIVVESLLNKVKEDLNENELFQVEATPTSGNRDFYVKCGMKYKPENQDGTYIWIKGK